MCRDTLLFLPTCNELPGISAIIPRLLDLFPPLQILVVDDGSTDGTHEWCTARAPNEPRLAILQRGTKQGLGTANVLAIHYAIRNGFRYLVTMDADASHDPRDVGRLLERMHAEPPCDVVIGSRYIRGGKITAWPIQRRVISRLVNWYAGAILRLPVRDCSSGFRCYRLATLARVDLEAFPWSGYDFYERILYLLNRCGARFAEVSITFTDRTAGQSKANRRAQLQAAWSLIRLGIVGAKTTEQNSSTLSGDVTCYNGD